MCACSWAVRRSLHPPSRSFHLINPKGSNWIPADNLLTRITPECYRNWLTLLRDGNQNMVRVWGGGIYEPDVFYDICDGMFQLHTSVDCR